MDLLQNDKLETLSHGSKGKFKEIKDFKMKKLQSEEDSNLIVPTPENTNMDKMDLIMKNIELMKNKEEIVMTNKEIKSNLY